MASGVHILSPMKSIYRYRKERHYAKPPEVSGRASPTPHASTSCPARLRIKSRSAWTRRVASIALRPPVSARCGSRWQEGFSEWEENRRLVQTRHFLNGPIRRFEAVVELYPDDTGTRMVFSSEIECAGVLGLLAKLSGQIDREGDKRLAAVEKLIAEADNTRCRAPIPTKR